MIKFRHMVVVLLLFVASHANSATLPETRFIPGTSYYFNDFDPFKKPWEPGQFMNFEEVFKNYQYFEILFEQGGNSFTVNRYIRGVKESSAKYLVLPDASLQKE